MTEDAALALVRSLPGCGQSAHMGTTDFRANNRIFASHPDPGTLVLKLTPEQQQVLVDAEPAMFAALPNRWGGKGWTAASIAMLDETTARSALAMAIGNVAARPRRKAG